MYWIISRNATDRPTLMHAVTGSADLETQCGVEIAGWSRHYLMAPLPFVGCKTCIRKTGFAAANAPVQLRSVS